MLYDLGISIDIIGNEVFVYPEPGFAIESAVIDPPEPTVAAIVAPVPIVDAILIFGAVTYPDPYPVK